MLKDQDGVPKSLRGRKMDGNVLIVDDSPYTRKEIKDILQEEELFNQYLEAEDGYSAIRVLSTKPVDMIICDIMMPNMDGFQLLNFIKNEKSLSDIMVIMISANKDILLKIKGLESGAFDYIVKPFHPKELLLRVKNLLRIKHLQKALEDKISELEKVTVIDNLTGLYNQRYLYDTLKREYNRCERFNLKLSVVMIDLDNFKDVNDTFGHQRGDVILREVGQILQAMLRGYDFAVRYGGDEFIIVLSQNSVIGAHIVAERIRRVIEGSPKLQELNGGRPVTVSVGVATYPDDTKDGYEHLIHLVDTALYRAKREGRNRVATPHKEVASNQ